MMMSNQKVNSVTMLSCQM